MSKWIQETFRLKPFSRGFHLITREIENSVPRLSEFNVGIANVFIMHTSAGLTINENADPTVRGDFERHFSTMVPDHTSYYVHTYEGPDDMSAHLKSSIVGCSLTIPVKNGRFHLGTWQGIYLCEGRERSSGRNITVTIHGE